jgi:hypothetical protein
MLRRRPVRPHHRRVTPHESFCHRDSHRSGGADRRTRSGRDRRSVTDQLSHRRSGTTPTPARLRARFHGPNLPTIPTATGHLPLQAINQMRSRPRRPARRPHHPAHGLILLEVGMITRARITHSAMMAQLAADRPTWHLGADSKAFCREAEAVVSQRLLANTSARFDASFRTQVAAYSARVVLGQPRRRPH